MNQRRPRERVYFTTLFAEDFVRSLRVSTRNGLGALSTFSTSMCEKEERKDKWLLRRSEIGPRTAFLSVENVTWASREHDRARIAIGYSWMLSTQRGLTMSLVPKGSDPSMTSGPFFIFESAV